MVQCMGNKTYTIHTTRAISLLIIVIPVIVTPEKEMVDTEIFMQNDGKRIIQQNMCC